MINHYNCIYMYTNLINGKRYVGKAKDFNNRHKQHLKGNEQLIDKKIKEYGQQNFKVEILIENVQDDDKLNEYEKFFIKRKRSHVSYGTGYNKTWGGDGYIFDEMINTEEIITNINNDRATVEFGCLKPNGEQGKISFSFNIDQLDLVDE